MMLQTAASVSETVSTPKSFSPKVADYYVYPRQGLCVVTGIKTLEVYGTNTTMIEFRPLLNLTQKIQVPLGKFASSGLRPPAALEEFLVALEEVGGRARGGGIWSQRATAYKEKMGDTHPVVLAEIIRDILGKKRSLNTKKDTDRQFENGTLRDQRIEISYSEEQLVSQTLALIASEFSYVTGISQKEASSLFLRAALNSGFKVENLMLKQVGAARMDDNTFRAHFGLSIKEATALKEGGAIIQPLSASKMAGQPSQSKAGALTLHSKTNRDGNVMIQTRGSVSTHSSRAVEVKGDLHDIYKRNLSMVGTTGVKWSAFKLAARTLNEGEFNLLCRVYFRKREHLESYARVATEIGTSAGSVQAAAEAAFSRLKSSARAQRVRQLEHIELNPVTDEAAAKSKTPRQVRGRPARASARRAETPSSLPVPPANAAIYAVEAPFAAEKGVMRGLFLKAATVLKPEELSVLSRLELRNKDQRMSLEDVAQEEEKDAAYIISVRDKASATLRAAYGNVTGRLANYSALNPYQVPEVKTRRVAAPRPVKEPRAAFSGATLQSAVVDGVMTLTLAIPVADIKGIDQFKVEVAFSADGETVKATGRLGHNRWGKKLSVSAPVSKP